MTKTKALSIYQAAIVGMSRCYDAPLPGHLPGICCDECRTEPVAPYKTVFFGAKKEWADDDVGWTVVRRKVRKVKKEESWMGQGVYGTYE
jgi:hypothetical protein